MKILLNTFFAILVSLSAFAQEAIKPGKFAYNNNTFVVTQHTAFPIYSIQPSPMKKIPINPERIENFTSEQMEMLYNSIEVTFSVAHTLLIKRYFINQDELKKNKESITIWFFCDAKDGSIIELNFVVNSNTKITTQDIGILYRQIMDSGVATRFRSFKNWHTKLNHIVYSKTFDF